jgi:hypothetical protein
MKIENPKQPLRIIKFEAQNIKALNAITICPDPGDPIVLLTGESDQGKSSSLDAIWMALGGKRMIPSEPLKKGQKKGFTYLDFGEFTIQREFLEGGKERFAVANREGFKPPSPQEFLNSKFNGRARNPLEFLRLNPKEQVEALQNLVKLDLDLGRLGEISGLPTKGIKGHPVSILESAYKHLFGKRTEVGKERDRLKGVVDSIAIPAGKEGVEPVSVQELFAERKKLEAMAKAKHEATDFAESVLLREKNDLAEALFKKQALLADLKREIERVQMDLSDMGRQMKEKEAEYQTARGKAESLPIPDFTEIDTRIAAADETNKLAGLIKQRQAAEQEHAAQAAAYQDHTDRLKAITEYKTQLIEQAGLPVAGLGFANGEVTYHDLPFSQACGRDKLLISSAICAAENPSIGILTFDAGWGDLDKKGRQALEDWARERGLQIWVIEVREEPGNKGFHIYGGAVVAVNGEANTGGGCLPGESPPAGEGGFVDADDCGELEVPSWIMP